MCKADMTPILLVPPGEAFNDKPMPEFRTPHVCRNFDKLKQWVMSERAVYPSKRKSLEIARKIRQQTGEAN
jgi:hypothetical protein